MVTVSNIAQRILDENGYTTSDISLTNLEYQIDNAIDTINLRAGTSIADLAGSADSKSITGTESEILVVKEIAILMLRAYKDRGPNATLSGLSVTAVLADPQYDYYSKAILEDIKHLRAASYDRIPFVVATDESGFE